MIGVLTGVVFILIFIPLIILGGVFVVGASLYYDYQWSKPHEDENPDW